jgi:hypothetical protein
MTDDVELAQWAFLNTETGDWIEVKEGTVHGPLSCPAEKVRNEYQRFYDFVGDADPALVDAWHFTENNKPGGLAEQVRNALGTQEQHAGDDNG